MPADERAERVTLKEYLTGLIDERTHRHEAHFAAVDNSIREVNTAVKDALVIVEKATVRAAIEVDRRLASVNEFRAQLADQQATLVRKTEVDIRFEALEKKLDTAIAMLQVAKGRDAGLSVAWTIGTAVLAVTIAAISVALSWKH